MLILLSLTIIVWIATALKQLNLLTSQGQGFLLFFKMTLLALPNLMVLIAPVAFLIACFHTLNRLNGDSEVIVITASGAPIWKVASPFLALASILCAIIVIMNLYLMPMSLRVLREYIVQVRTDLISQVLQPGRFSSPEKGLTFHIRDKDRQGDLYGLMLHDERDKTQTMSFLAERGRIIKQDGRPLLLMFNGHIQRKPEKDTVVQIIAFEQYIFDISQFGPKGGKIEYKPRERYLGELLNPEPDSKLYKRQPGKFRSELHERFASALYPLLFALIAVVTLGQARTTRQGRINSILIGFSIAAMIRVMGLAATNLLSLKAWAVVLVYGIPIIALLGTLILAQIGMSPQIRAFSKLRIKPNWGTTKGQTKIAT